MRKQKYKMVKAFPNDFLGCRTFIWKKPSTFDQLKEGIADAFYKGIKSVCLYKDGRNTKNFLEVRADQFDKSFQEACYKKLQRQNIINQKMDLIKSCRNDIKWNRKRISELKQEIKSL